MEKLLLISLLSITLGYCATPSNQDISGLVLTTPSRDGWVNPNLGYWSTNIPTGKTEAPSNPYPTLGSWNMVFFQKIQPGGIFHDRNGKRINFQFRHPSTIDFEGIEVPAVRRAVENADSTAIKNAQDWQTIKPWPQITDQLITAYGLDTDLTAQARLRDVIGSALNDGFVIWAYYKNKWNIPRPNQIDTTLITHLCTHNSPSYPSGQAVDSALSAVILGYFFPNEKDRLIDISLEAARARVVGGVHTPADVIEGHKLGVQIGLAIVNVLKQEVDVFGNPTYVPYPSIGFDPVVHVERNLYSMLGTCPTGSVSDISVHLSVQP